MASELDTLLAENAALKAENAALRTRLSTLEAKLAEALRLLGTPKNSGNSSMPPSSDLAPRKNQALRKPSGLKPGAQPGHPGRTLEMTETPDFIVDHVPDYCHGCGNDLLQASLAFVGKLQVVDIPPVLPVWTEHRFFSKTCACGCVTGERPPGRSAVVKAASTARGWSMCSKTSLQRITS